MKVFKIRILSTKHETKSTFLYTLPNELLSEKLIKIFKGLGP